MCIYTLPSPYNLIVTLLYTTAFYTEIVQTFLNHLYLSSMTIGNFSYINCIKIHSYVSLHNLNTNRDTQY